MMVNIDQYGFPTSVGVTKKKSSTLNLSSSSVVNQLSPDSPIVSLRIKIGDLPSGHSVQPTTQSPELFRRNISTDARGVTRTCLTDRGKHLRRYQIDPTNK